LLLFTLHSIKHHLVFLVVSFTPPFFLGNTRRSSSSA
jgi:hypothetical protein